jgi:hypothetical protein
VVIFQTQHYSCLKLDLAQCRLRKEQSSRRFAAVAHVLLRNILFITVIIQTTDQDVARFNEDQHTSAQQQTQQGSSSAGAKGAAASSKA